MSGAVSFSIPTPRLPKIDSYQVGGVFIKSAYYFDEFLVTVISSTSMPEDDLARWSDVSPIDVGFLHISPLRLRHGFGGALRNYTLWHSRKESCHFQERERDTKRLFGLVKKKQYTRCWRIPQQIHDYIEPTYYGNAHLVGVDPSLSSLIRPGCVLKMSGHSLNWARIGDDGSIYATEWNGRKFGLGNNDCVLFLPEKLEVIEHGVVRRITDARDIARLSENSFVELIERRDLLLLANKGAPTVSISNLPCVIDDQRDGSSVRLDHSIYCASERARILITGLFFTFRFSLKDRREFVCLNRGGGNWKSVSWRVKLGWTCLTICVNAGSDNVKLSTKFAGIVFAFFLFGVWLVVRFFRLCLRAGRWLRQMPLLSAPTRARSVAD